MAATTASVLARGLRVRISGEVRVDAGARAIRHGRLELPAAAARRGDADVEAAVAVCRERQLPVLARGGGSSLAGRGCNTAVLLDFSRHMNRILDLDADTRTATVRKPGETTCRAWLLRKHPASTTVPCGRSPAWLASAISSSSVISSRPLLRESQADLISRQRAHASTFARQGG
jgi:hypothetical protein